MKRLLQQVALVVTGALAGTTLTLSGAAYADHDLCALPHDMGSSTSGVVSTTNRQDWWESNSNDTIRSFTLTPQGGDADLRVYAADCTTLLCSSTFGGTSTDTCTIDRSGPVHPRVDYYSSPTGAVPYTLTTSGTPAPSVTSVPPVIEHTSRYPSDDCTGGADLMSGFVGQNYVTARQQRPDADTTWVCVRIDGPVAAYGGKLIVDDPKVPAVGLPSTDTNWQACSAAGNQVPGPHPLFAATVAGLPFHVDTYANGSGASLCLLAGSSALRVHVPVSVTQLVPGVRFQVDVPGRHWVEPAVPAEPSGSCQADRAPRVADLTSLGSRAYLYTDSSASDDGSFVWRICVGAAALGQTGGVLTVRSAGPNALPYVTTGETWRCTDSLAKVTSPTYLEVKTGRTPTSASACLLTATAAAAVSVVSGNGEPIAVSWTPDSGTPDPVP